MMRACFVLSLTLAGTAWAATEEQCNQMLEQALQDKNPDTRKQAVVALSLAATGTPAFGRLEGMLADKDVEVRLAIVAGLAELKTASARAALHKALEDAVPEVSFAAAKALWLLKDPAGEAALLAVLQQESKSSSGYLTKEKRNAQRMLHTPNTLFLFAARTGLGFAPVPGLGQGFTSMEALLTDPSISGRATAALLLGTDKSAATLAALRDALSDKNWTVRAAAVHSLAVRNDPALEKDIEPLLDDKKEGVRLRAAAGCLRLLTVPAPKKKKR